MLACFWCREWVDPVNEYERVYSNEYEEVLYEIFLAKTCPNCGNILSKEED